LHLGNRAFLLFFIFFLALLRAVPHKSTNRVRTMKILAVRVSLLGVFSATLGSVLLETSSAQPPVVIANWTFETTQPAASPGAGVWITNIAAEIGSGIASGFHSGASVYSTPAGNGSSHSFSSTLWAVGDLYQFVVSTAGRSGVSIGWDQTSSGTGPGKFNLAYSTDGQNFTTILTDYSILPNASPNPVWNATTSSSLYSYFLDLSGNSALDNQPTLYFRLIDDSTTSANGGTVGTGGTDRVDNFLVEVPEPRGLLLIGALGLFAWIWVRSHFRPYFLARVPSGVVVAKRPKR
jgi:hypothetical protein